jgi:hypothetical protein
MNTLLLCLDFDASHTLSLHTHTIASSYFYVSVYSLICMHKNTFAGADPMSMPHSMGRNPLPGRQVEGSIATSAANSMVKHFTTGALVWYNIE